MNFTYDWFTGNLEYIVPIIERYKPKSILEIGSFEGLSTHHLLDQASKYTDVTFYAVDTWAGSEEHVGYPMSEIEQRFDANIQETLEHCKKINGRDVYFNKVKTTSSRALSILLLQDLKFDLIYVDGSHRASDVFIDAAQSFRLLNNETGILIFDDYDWFLSKDNYNSSTFKYSTPKLAIDCFAECFSDKIVSLYPDGTYQKYYRKVKE